MNCTYVSSKLLTVFLKELNSLDSLAYYIAAKKHHKSGDVLSLRKLSQKIGCSHNTLSFHLKRFQELGLLSINGGRLFFVSTRKLTWERGTKHLRSINKVVKRNLYLKFESTQVRELKKELRQFILLNALHKQGLLQKKQRSVYGADIQHAGISANALGKKINRSRSSGQRLVDSMRKQNIIKVTPKFTYLGDSTLHEFRHLKNIMAIPQHSKIEDGRITAQTYSEMEVVKKMDGYVTIKGIHGNFVKEIKESVTVKMEKYSHLPFFPIKPSGYFSRNLLKNKGFSKKEIDRLFQVQAITISGGFGGRNTGIMAYSLMGELVRTESKEVQEKWRNKQGQQTSTLAASSLLLLVPTF
jgi:DNA-binding transcriptional regulator YhcF (GntR family)